MWLRFLLPVILQFINRIPWNWRCAVTVLTPTLLIFGGVLTLAAFDCWYQRNTDHHTLIRITALDEFCDTYYGNRYMERRFETMILHPDQATRF